MDCLQFIASIVESVAWPIAFCLAVWFFKRPIADLLPRITDVELWGGKATFSKGLQDAEATAENIPSAEEGVRPESTTKPDDPYLELAERFPEAAIMDSYKLVEAVFDENRKELGMSESLPPRGIVEILRREEFVSSEVYSLYRQISETRNAAVHSGGRTITAGEAMAYRDLCVRLVVHLRKAFKRKAKAKPKTD